MFSEMIRRALEREVVGQSEAVNTIARGVTRLVSSVTPSERAWGSYLLLGPPGTGRGHLVRSLARILYLDGHVFTLHANTAGHVDPWRDFLSRLEPLFATRPPVPKFPTFPSVDPERGTGQPLRLVLVDDLERAHKDLFPQLAYLLECGQEVLPDGRCLRLDGVLFFFTTGLCADQILDQPRIGFSGTAREAGEDNGGAIQKICREEAETSFGRELMGQFDDFIVFQPLDAVHLSDVLDRHFARLGRWLELRGIHGELTPRAKEFLLALAGGEPQGGARDLVRIHRDEVEFPVADLLVSGALQPGYGVELDRRPGEEHLHLSVLGTHTKDEPLDRSLAREIPVLAGTGGGRP